MFNLNFCKNKYKFFKFSLIITFLQIQLLQFPNMAMPPCVFNPCKPCFIPLIIVRHSPIIKILFHFRVIEYRLDKINNSFNHFHPNTTPFSIPQRTLSAFLRWCIFRLRCIDKWLGCSFPYFRIYLSFLYLRTDNSVIYIKTVARRSRFRFSCCNH